MEVPGEVGQGLLLLIKAQQCTHGPDIQAVYSQVQSDLLEECP